MSDAELQTLIAKKEALIARLEARAERCNSATELGRALASRARTSAAYQRKLLDGLRHRRALSARAAPDGAAGDVVTHPRSPLRG